MRLLLFFTCVLWSAVLPAETPTAAGIDDSSHGLTIWLSHYPEDRDPPHESTRGAVVLNTKNTGRPPWFFGRDAYHRGMKLKILDESQKRLIPDDEWAKLQESPEYNHFRRHVRLASGETTNTVLLLGHHFAFARGATCHIEVTWTSCGFRARPEMDTREPRLPFRLSAGPLTLTTAKLEAS